MVNNMAKKYKGLQLEIRKFYKNNFNLVVQIVDRIPQGYVDNQGLVYGMAGVCNSKGRNWDLYTETTEDELIKQNAVNYKGESLSEAVAENVADEVIKVCSSEFTATEQMEEILREWTSKQPQKPTKEEMIQILEKMENGLEVLKKMGRSMCAMIDSFRPFVSDSLLTASIMACESINYQSREVHQAIIDLNCYINNEDHGIFGANPPTQDELDRADQFLLQLNQMKKVK